MAMILVVHGPNLNMLGSRETSIYGNTTLASIDASMTSLANDLGHSIETCQSNAEHVLIERIQKTRDDATAFIIINPAAYTHTSIALRDALLAANKPFVEVHLSNIYRRETFRQHSYFSDIAIGILTGLGAEGYLLAVRYAHHYLTTSSLQQ